MQERLLVAVRVEVIRHAGENRQRCGGVHVFVILVDVKASRGRGQRQDHVNVERHFRLAVHGKRRPVVAAQKDWRDGRGGAGQHGRQSKLGRIDGDIGGDETVQLKQANVLARAGQRPRRRGDGRAVQRGDRIEVIRILDVVGREAAERPAPDAAPAAGDRDRRLGIKKARPPPQMRVHLRDIVQARDPGQAHGDRAGQRRASDVRERHPAVRQAVAAHLNAEGGFDLR